MMKCLDRASNIPRNLTIGLNSSTRLDRTVLLLARHGRYLGVNRFVGFEGTVDDIEGSYVAI